MIEKMTGGWLQSFSIFFQPMFDARITTDPLVEIRSRFIQQSEILKGEDENYLIRIVAPVREDVKTLGIIEVWEEFSIKEAYVRRNNSRLIMLAAISAVTLVFGFFLALGIARPIRKLSRGWIKNFRRMMLQTSLKVLVTKS